MSSVNFTVLYDGPALQDNRMDVRDLAPALLSLGNLFEESNALLNKNRTSINVKVKAFENGSFGISIESVQSITEQLVSLFTRENIRTTSEIAITLGFLYGTGRGLIWIIKKLRDKKVEDIIPIDGGNFKLRAKDLELEVPSDVIKCYENLNVRKALGDFTKPLEKEGIESLKLIHNKKVETTIDKSEARFFIAPEVVDEQIGEDETIKNFTIHLLSFKEDNKWRLSDGVNNFWVTIKDQDFLNKVNENQIYFAKGDILKTKLKTLQWKTSEGLKTEYEIISVIEHKSGTPQLRLPFKDMK